ncbi:MAG: hypothetical protein KDB79_05330 [Acidobacteria bacterium]|nr:hypothetical protein [Acidobacteriota bacterium]
MTAIVATLISVEGPKLMYSRRFSTGDSEFYLAKAGLQIHLYDVFQTNEFTKAVIRFNSGKRVQIDSGKRILISARESIIDATFGTIDPDMRDLYKYETFDEIRTQTIKRRWLES